MHAPTTLLLAGLVLLAGCADDQAQLPRDAESKDPGVGAPAATGDVGPPPDLDQTPAPAWQPGEWWDWRVETHWFADHAPLDVRTTVADLDGTAYYVGATDLDAGLEALAFHVPPLGTVSPSDLAWEAHDGPVQYVSFPLWDGREFAGQIHGDPLAMTARALDGPTGPEFVIEGLFQGGAKAVEVAYSPALGTFREIRVYYGAPEPYAVATVQGHGFAEPGPSHVLWSDDALLHASSFSHPSQPQTFTVPDWATHVVAACALMGGAGAFAVSLVPAGGVPWTCDAESAGDPVSRMEIEVFDGPTGTWTAAFATGGPGWVEAEVFAVVSLTCPAAGGGSVGDVAEDKPQHCEV